MVLKPLGRRRPCLHRLSCLRLRPFSALARMQTPSIFGEAKLSDLSDPVADTFRIPKPPKRARIREPGDDGSDTQNTQIDRLAKQAAEGNAAAQLQYGLRYDLGDGVPLDATTAAYWYMRSARQGVVAAQYRLACSLWFGRGVPNDFINASQLYEKATMQGYCGRTAVVLPDESANAVRSANFANRTWVPPLWYRPAAEERFNHAHYRLGQCYSEGLGIDQDPELAAHHFNIAASLHTFFNPHGHGGAQSTLAMCYFEGRGVEESMDSAIYWWRRAASQRVPDACNNLGAAMQLGLTGQRDERKGFELFLDAARHGHASAEFNVAECYAAGRGVGQDFKEAAAWYAKAADKGYVQAMRNLAICYEHGIGVEKSDAKAIELRARMELVDDTFMSTSEEKQFRRMATYFAL